MHFLFDFLYKLKSDGLYSLHGLRRFKKDYHDTLSYNVL